MDEAVPDLSGQVAGLLDGTIDLDWFHQWFIMNGMAIEVRGTDDEVDFHHRIENLFAE